MSKKFCPKCGAVEGIFIGQFCKQCYLQDHKVAELPEALVIEVCKNCGKFKWKGKWHVQETNGIRQFVESKVKLDPALNNPKVLVELEPNDDGTTTADVHVNGIIGRSPINVIRTALLKPKSVLCDPCMRMSSYYHEAILQLRYPKKPTGQQRSNAVRVVEAVMRTESKRDQLAGIVDIKGARNGLDFLIGSKRAAKAAADRIAREQGTSVIRSHKVTGVERSGKEKKRYTFCVKIK